MSEPEHLSQAERLIAECKNRIARQREVIANAFQKGRCCEHWRQAFEPSRRTANSSLKNRRSGDDRQEPHHDLRPQGRWHYPPSLRRPALQVRLQKFLRNRQPTAARSSKSLPAQRIDVRLEVPTDTARLPL